MLHVLTEPIKVVYDPSYAAKGKDMDIKTYGVIVRNQKKNKGACDCLLVLLQRLELATGYAVL